LTIGNIYQKQVNGNRKEHLTATKESLLHFLEVATSYGIPDAADQEAVKRTQSGEAIDPRFTRDEKVSRAKRQKEAKDKIRVLISRKVDRMRKAMTQGDEAITAAEEHEEEEERDLLLIQIQDAVRTAVDEIYSIDRELEILQHMEKMKMEGKDPAVEAKKERDLVLQKTEKRAPFKITSTKGLPPQVLNTADPNAVEKLIKSRNRNDMRRQMMKPYWNLPTMTPEEAAEIEMKYAIQNGGEQSAKVESDEESDPDDDAAAQKKREWDDWKDDHPWGSGNTHNRS